MDSADGAPVDPGLPLPLGGTWRRRESVSPAMDPWTLEITVQQTDPNAETYELSAVLFERLLTEAGYTRTPPDKQENP